MRKASLSFALLAVLVAVPLWGQRSLLKSLGVVKPSMREFNDSVQSANLDNVKIGIKAKFDVKERFNGTPYVLSALRYRSGPEAAQVIAALLDAGADVNATAVKAEGSEFVDRETALMRASLVECAASRNPVSRLDLPPGHGIVLQGHRREDLRLGPSRHLPHIRRLPLRSAVLVPLPQG
jgi:hypothetical protein